jgi:hypothetical protein
MRRFLFTAVASAALLAVGPSAAMARSHHQRSHHRSQSRHHRTVRHLRFGLDRSPSTTASPTPETSAGRVVSFTGGVLTIKLNDGTMVKGQVSGATGLECEAANSTSTFQTDRRSRDGGGGDQGGGSDDETNGKADQGDEAKGNDQGDEAKGNDQAEQGGQGDNEAEGETACPMTALSPNAVVREADLRISSAGAVWDKIELIA